MSDKPIVVTHTEDPACPGHDVNVVLARKSIELGQCYCVHPFMQTIDFTGLVCDWCRQPVTSDNMSPEAKEIRSAAVRAALGDGKGACTNPADRNPAGRPWRGDQ